MEKQTKKGGSEVRRRRKSTNSLPPTDEYLTQREIFNKIQDLKFKKSLSEDIISKNGKSVDEPLLFSPSIDFKLQIIIVGDRNVGKTCFLERYTDGQFRQELRSTVGIDFRIKTINVAGRHIRLQIWDTAGQERFNSITTAYYRNAQGVVMVYDVTRPETFQSLTNWLDLVKEYGRSDVEIAIVGNKADLPDVQVNPHKARNFAEQSGFMFYETSAKESFNVDTVFVNLVYKILKQIPQPHERNPRIRRKPTRSQSLRETADQPVKQQRGGGCC